MRLPRGEGRSWRWCMLGVVLAACSAGAPRAQANPFVYVAGTNIVSQFDAIGGSLTPLSPPAVTCVCGPSGIAVSPDGRSVYVTHFVNPPALGTVSQFDVGAGGALTPKVPATVTAGNGPLRIAVTPDGKSVYVTDINDNAVSQYDVGAGGALTPKTPPTVPAGDTPLDVAVSPDGKSAYVTDRALLGGTVSQFDIAGAGTLIAKTPPTVPTVGSPCDVAVNPDGRSVYVTDCFVTPRVLGSSVAQYDVGVGGALVPKAPAAAQSGSGPVGIAVSPDGKSVYVANLADNSVSQYDVGAGGALTPKFPAAVAAGTGPIGVVASPDGKSLYVTNGGDGTVSQYDVGPTGALTPKRPASVAAGTNPAAIAVTRLAAPASTPGCAVSGHGRITAADGDRAGFRGFAAATPPRGRELYRDKGPANPVDVVSTRIDALVCSHDLTRATVSGTATVNGAAAVEFRIDIQLAARRRSKGAYRIRLSSGYDSGPEPVRRGHLEIRLRGS
jgi:DNA-binding beta-propeller fold protein YncE